MKHFYKLSVTEIKKAISKIPETEGLIIEDEVLMPEADVLLCRYRGLRFNIRVDVVYGAEAEPIDIFTKVELDTIKKQILAVSEGSIPVIKETFKLYFKDLFIGTVVKEATDFFSISGKIEFNLHTLEERKQLQEYIYYSIEASNKVLGDVNTYEDL